MPRERYAPPSRKPPGNSSAWEEAAKKVLLDMLDDQYAVTVSEIEARGSDRTWNPLLWPWPINPHHFTNARVDLADTGDIEPASAPTRSHLDPIITWSRPPTRGNRRRILSAAARKRLLTARHAGWARRGGAGRGLIGRAGEDAVHTAMTEAPNISQVSGSTNELLDISLPGELDNSAFYVDLTTTPTAITIMVEVKNTRSWYYADDVAVLRFLAKASHVQQERPEALVLPVFICRQFQYKLWELGERHGFLPAKVENQLVQRDSDLSQESINQVANELGYGDLRLGNAPTNRHRGIFNTSIPRYARTYAERWRLHHVEYLATDPNLGTTDEPDR